MPRTATTKKPEVEQQQDRVLTRYLSASEVQVAQDTRTIQVSFSSDRPVERYFWMSDAEMPDGASYVFDEVISHDPSHWNLERVNNGVCGFLKNHDRHQKLGTVLSVNFQGNKGYADIKLRRTDDANQLLIDLEDETAGGVSFRYIVTKYKVITPAEYEAEGMYSTRLKKKAVLEAIAIELLEISNEEMPADPTVGFGKSFLNSREIQIDGNPGWEIPVVNREEPMATQPVTPSPESQERTYSAAEVEALKRELTQAQTEREAIERRSQITDKFHGLRQRAEKLVGELKLCTAAYEEMFGANETGQRSVIDSLIQDGGKAGQIDFYLSQQEKYAVAPTAFGKSIVGQTELPPPPGERSQQTRSPEEIQATAQRLANAAINQRTVI